MDTNIDFLASIVSNDSSYGTLVDMIKDLDLELVAVDFFQN